MKQWLMIMLCSSVAMSDGLYILQYSGINVQDRDGKEYKIEREVPATCLDIPIDNSTIWEGHYASDDVPVACKASFVKTVGMVSPMVIADGIETYGELEVMQFIKEMASHEDYLLVDSRGEEWYEYETIPGAVNFWFTLFKQPDLFPDEFERVMVKIGVQKNRDGRYDFSHAKSLLLFCNGPWCGQSPAAIKGLLKLGYPAEKIKWYRGGMHDWKSLSMTTTRSR